MGERGALACRHEAAQGFLAAAYGLAAILTASGKGNIDDFELDIAYEAMPDPTSEKSSPSSYPPGPAFRRISAASPSMKLPPFSKR